MFVRMKRYGSRHKTFKTLTIIRTRVLAINKKSINFHFLFPFQGHRVSTTYTTCMVTIFLRHLWISVLDHRCQGHRAWVHRSQGHMFYLS